MFLSQWTAVAVQMAPRRKAPIRTIGSTMISRDSIVPGWREVLSGRSRRDLAPPLRLVIALLFGPTFSSDVAYSNSPAASRASSRSLYSCTETILPSRIRTRSTRASRPRQSFPSASPVHQSRHDTIAGVEEFERHGAEPLHLLLNVRNQVLHSVYAVKDIQPGVIGGAMPFDLRCVRRYVRLSRASEVLVAPSNQIDVLLRHRPRSIPRRRGRCRSRDARTQTLESVSA